MATFNLYICDCKVDFTHEISKSKVKVSKTTTLTNIPLILSENDSDPITKSAKKYILKQITSKLDGLISFKIIIQSKVFSSKLQYIYEEN